MQTVGLCDLTVQYGGEGLAPRALQPFCTTAACQAPCLQIAVQHTRANPHPPADFSLSILSFANGEQGQLKWAWNTYADAALLTFAQEGQVTLSELDAGCHDSMRLNLLLAAFLPQLARREGLAMHGALVEYAGGAVIFTASPGVGKSTHAELWRSALGARILNGDKAFVRRVDGMWNAYGSPWSGSSPYVVCAQAPLRAIVVLEQAKENRIRRLSGMELLARLTTHIYYPSWDAVAVQYSMHTMDAMLAQLPVYLLSCLPDRGAAALARDTIFGKGEMRSGA